MPRQPSVQPNTRETLVLLDGLIPSDYELAYGGDYLFSVRTYKGTGAGGWNGASVQLQYNQGTLDRPDWVSSGAAVTQDMAAAVGMGVGAGTPLRVTLTGAPTGAGLLAVLQRMPA